MKSFIVYIGKLMCWLAFACLSGPATWGQEASENPYSTLEDLTVEFIESESAQQSAFAEPLIPDPSQLLTDGPLEATWVDQVESTDSGQHPVPPAVARMASAAQQSVSPQPVEHLIPAPPEPESVVSPEPVELIEPVQVPVNPLTPAMIGQVYSSGGSSGTCQQCEQCRQGGQCENPICCQCDRCKPIRSMYRYYKRVLLGDPDLFCERRYGTYTRSALNAQILAGKASRMVLYHYDFFDGQDSEQVAELKPRGRRELIRIGGLMMSTGMPMTIESTDGNPELDEHRRQSVLATLSSFGFDPPPESVVVAHPSLPGLGGMEADLQYRGMLFQAIRASSVGGGQGGGGGGGGFGGGGGGFGGGGGGFGGGGGGGGGSGSGF